ncbi:MAG: hypothetical protein AAGJ31_11480 [Verrucomicrobiota bacterium]
MMVSLPFLLSGCFRPTVWEERSVQTGYRGEARYEPFLAAARFAEEDGWTVDEQFQLTELPEQGVTVLLPSEGDRNRASASRLEHWIREGGHLIYLLEGADSFRNDFPIPPWPRDERPQDGSPELQEEEPSEKRYPKLAAESPGKGETEADELEGKMKDPNRFLLLKQVGIKITPRTSTSEQIRWRGPSLSVEIPEGIGVKVPPRIMEGGPRVFAGTRQSRAFASFPLGEGRFTILSHAQPWRNRFIGDHDHAHIFHLTLGLGKSSNVLWIVRSTNTSFFGLLWNHGSRVILSFLAFLGLWLWWATRRTGPLLPETEPGNRDFADHLKTSGKFLWGLPGGSAVLLQPVRNRILRREGIHDSLTEEARQERLVALASRVERESEEVEDALFGKPPTDPGRFTRFVELLRTLESTH